MKIKTLQMVQAVAETGSISQAAEKLHCVQSNVTMRIKALEQQLGVDLFYRGNHGLSLTLVGQAFTKHINHALFEIDLALQQVSTDPTKGGMLNIGSIRTLAAVYTPDCLAAYHRCYPKVSLTLQTDTTAVLVDKVLEHQLMLAFVGTVVSHPDLVCVPIMKDELRLILPKEVAHLDQLNPLSFIAFPPGCSFYDRVEAYCKDLGYWPLTVQHFDSLDVILGCVSAGMGATVLPTWIFYAEALVNKYTIQPLPKAYSQIEVCLVFHRHIAQSKMIKTFLKVAADLKKP